jgi:hypothetical protein
MKLSLTKKSRADLSRGMRAMCHPLGWQSSTLNPDMPDSDKRTLIAVQVDRLVNEEDPGALYDCLIALSAVAMGWAQGNARRAARDRKRASRERKAAKRRGRQKARDDKRAAQHVAKEHEPVT